MAIERIWDIQGFNGGECDDITQGPTNSFWSGENIDIRKDLAGMKLSSNLVDTGWSISGEICLVENLEKWGLSGILVCTKTGNIYLDGVPKKTLTSTSKIISGVGVILVSGQNYIYYISTGGGCAIHRSTPNLETWNEDYRTFTGYEATNVTVLVSDIGGIIFNVNNKIKELTNTEVLRDALLLPENTVGFTRFQNNYKIYANSGTTGVQYQWTYGEAFPSYRQTWENQPIRAVSNDGAYDIAILGVNEFKSDLYLIPGTQKEPVRVALENNDNSRRLFPFVSSRLGIVFVSGGLTGESDKYGIYTYGSLFPGSPKSLCQEYSGKTTKFTYHTHTTAYSYFANADGKVYVTSHSVPPTSTTYTSSAYSSSGYVITRKWQGNIWEEKSFTKMKVGFYLKSGSSIKIYARTDISSSWQLAKTIDYATYGSKKSLVMFENELKALGLGNFNELQLKFELISGGTVNTPTLYRATVFTEVVGNQ